VCSTLLVWKGRQHGLSYIIQASSKKSLRVPIDRVSRGVMFNDAVRSNSGLNPLVYGAINRFYEYIHTRRQLDQCWRCIGLSSASKFGCVGEQS